MIRNFRHRGLQRLFERGDRSRIRADFVDKVERVLARLDASADPADMEAPGFGLHAMTGDHKGFWSVVPPVLMGSNFCRPLPASHMDRS